jgi:hypothetical protein
MDLPRKLELLAKDYGLQEIMEQNDIEEEFVLGILYNEGLFDMEDYFYEDEEILNDSD